MRNNSTNVISWRKRTKERIVQSFGGKCNICGYFKCLDALELHHLDPHTKDFPIGKVLANPNSWDKIVNELRKCVLLCSNCHREVHAGIAKTPDKHIRFDESFADYKKNQEEERKKNYYNFCPICGGEKFYIQKTCSYKCASQLSGRYNWNSIDLADLYLNKRIKIQAIADIIGCSYNAVKKRLVKLQLLVK